MTELAVNEGVLLVVRIEPRHLRDVVAQLLARQSSFRGPRATLFLLVLCLCVNRLAFAQPRRQNPYPCQNTAKRIGETHSLQRLRDEAAKRSQSASSAVDFCTVAELLKRLGDSNAQLYFEKAIDASPTEPAYELFLANYFRVYRGAGQRPLFPQAEKHLLTAVEKLEQVRPQAAWDAETRERLQRSVTALYERDGIPLATRQSFPQGRVQHPWMFFSPGARLARAPTDFDQTSDVRDLTAAALFSENCLPEPVRRLCSVLNPQQLSGVIRPVIPLEVGGDIRMRYNGAPVVDITASARRTGDAVIPNYFTPNSFGELKLTNIGLRIEEPFAVGGGTDATVAFSVNRISRKGLIEFNEDTLERIRQYQAYGAASQYIGPDRLNVTYMYTYQAIDPTPSLDTRDRRLIASTINYQVFRPLSFPTRNANAGLGRSFDTRGIDIFGGLLIDRDRYAGTTPSVIQRRDYFAGIAAHGVGPVDLTVQPTWFSSEVSNDPTQANSQMRLAGSALIRLSDEERTPGIPSARLFGMPVAFVQLAFPFHWDVSRAGLNAFESRRLGVELSTKVFSDSQFGMTMLATIGYSSQWFPELNRHLNLAQLSLSMGF